MKRYAFLAFLLVVLPAFAQQAPTTFKLALDPQALQQTPTNTPTTNSSNPPHHPPTLLDERRPSESALSEANIELLAKNAALTRQVDDLTIQLGVLTEERSGQLFFYGAITSFVSILMGFVLAKILERQRWR